MRHLHRVWRPPRRLLALAGGCWAAAAAVALLAAGQWMDRPSVQYLLVCVVATVAALGCASWLRGSQRVWALACGGVQLVLCIAAAQSQRQLSAVAGNWVHWRGEVDVRGLQALRVTLDETLASVTQAASAAAQAPADRLQAFARLHQLVHASDEQGVVLYRGDSAYAWAGRLRVPTDSLRAPVGVAANPFYLALFATASRSDARAIATAILAALPPADRLTDPLARRTARRVGLDDFLFTAPSDSAGRTSIRRGVLHYAWQGRQLLDARPASLGSDQMLLHLTERARLDVGALLVLALGCFIIAAWRGTRAIQWRLTTLAVALLCTGLVPLNSFSSRARLFDATYYFTALGRALTASAGALAITSALALLGLFTILRRGRRPSRWTGLLIVLLVAGLGPFLLRDLARGIHLPAYGVSASLWLIWEIPLFLAAMTVLLAGAGAGSVLLGRHRGLPTWVAPALAAAAALLALLVWLPPGQWPWWYTFVWIAAIAALALGRQTRGVVISVATVAALGAVTLVWGRTARARVMLAEHDVTSLGVPDPEARALLERFGDELQGDVAPASRAELLRRYITSDLAAASYPTALFAWPTDSAPNAALQTATFGIPMPEVAHAVADARRTRRPVVRAIAGDPAMEQLLAVPGSGGGVTAVVVAPRTRLILPDPFVRILGLDLAPEGEPPYTVQLSPLTAGHQPPEREHTVWREREDALHGDWSVHTGTGLSRAHVEVQLRPLSALVQRGTLIVLLDLAIVGVLWLLSVFADGGVGRWLRARRRTWVRSYRLRLTLALFAFFVIPALAFAVWSYRQLSADAVQSRELLVKETLRAVAPVDSTSRWVENESGRLATPLLLYSGGELRDASDPLYESLSPVGRFLREDIERLLVIGDEDYATFTFDIGSASTLFGFRSVNRPGLPDLVLAAPARAAELPLESRRRDLGVLVLFSTAVGAVAALWLSGIAARELARPIRTLRHAALSIASGEQMPPLEGEPTVEFHPVFTAFRRMAADLAASRSALEESQRRTAAILRNVASGVIAVAPDGRVVLANPRADDLLRVPLPPGTVLARAVPRELSERVLRFLQSAADDEAFEVELDGQQLRGRITRLARGGVVVTLDDVSELARAQRVLAWGEMARQIAHEIKNPLTPIRLGVQHLRRARADQRVDFDRVLDQNVTRILREIDRLDEIARAFSKYGSAPGERAPAVPTDVAAVLRDVVALESMAAESVAAPGESPGHVEWRVQGAASPVTALARADELREVLLNVFENARLAGARHVHIQLAQAGDGEAGRDVVLTVHDDGHGIAEDVLPRVFEPHFSTRTSGSGLGLAISRQIIDGWGGDISVASAPRQGTTVRIVLRPGG
ncbi:MAG TPA: ATP-binding protein [Gemmatimonadaceae bacterium]|nr:ATP-binding protein [Gemmatimonadaceae bacterium]